MTAKRKINVTVIKNVIDIAVLQCFVYSYRQWLARGNTSTVCELCGKVVSKAANQGDTIAFKKCPYLVVGDFNANSIAILLLGD